MNVGATIIYILCGTLIMSQKRLILLVHPTSIETIYTTGLHDSLIVKINILQTTCLFNTYFDCNFSTVNSSAVAPKLPFTKHGFEL